MPVTFPGEQGHSPQTDKREMSSGECEAWGPAASLSRGGGVLVTTPADGHLQTGMLLPALRPPLVDER